jgi:hypothetical protein
MEVRRIKKCPRGYVTTARPAIVARGAAMVVSQRSRPVTRAQRLFTIFALPQLLLGCQLQQDGKRDEKYRDHDQWESSYPLVRLTEGQRLD